MFNAQGAAEDAAAAFALDPTLGQALTVRALVHVSVGAFAVRANSYVMFCTA